MEGQKKSLKIIDSEGVSRRDFLKVLGLGVSATAVGCADSAKQNILPYVKGEAEQVPGVSVYYNTTCTECSAGCGVRVRTREGRAVMVEGNHAHPVNRGGLCAIGHSALQHMYDPDRVRQPLLKKDVAGKEQFVPISWKEAEKEVVNLIKKAKGKKVILTGALGDAQESLVESWSSKFDFEHVTYDAADPVMLAKAAELVYGTQGIPEVDFAKAEVVLNFGADFMETWVSPCGYSRDWADSRKSSHPVRVIHVEPRRSLTGANADQWLKVKSGSEVSVALAVIKMLLERGQTSSLDSEVLSGLRKITKGINPEKVAEEAGISFSNLATTVEYLSSAKHSLVVAGGAGHASDKSLALLVAANLINVLLGNVGSTVKLSQVRKVKTSVQAFVKLLGELKNAEEPVDLLVIYNTNPAFTSPVSSGFKYAAKMAGTVVSFSSHLDETAKLATLILPANVGLESWGSDSPYSGVKSLQQPVMTPVFDTREFGDILISLAVKLGNNDYPASFQDYVKSSWKEVYSTSGESGSFDKFWLKSLERGGYFSKSTSNNGKAKVSQAAFDLNFGSVAEKTTGAELLLYAYPSVKTFDGRSANRPWMQELPDPMSKVVWDTWAEINPKTASKLGLSQGDSLAVTNSYGQLNIPVHITSDVSEEIVAVPFGNGHSDYGRYARQIGGGNVYDMFPEFSEDGFSFAPTVVQVAKGRKQVKLVRTQEFSSQMNRHLAQNVAIKPGAHHEAHASHHEPEQVYEQRISPLYHWVMAIDLAACTGCSACVVACNAENNIPSVGKEVNYQGREMSWLRIERYDDVDHENSQSEELQVSFLPMMCQHCQNAPCEPVCPVYATYHNEEGLNAMVYNRCVGTRYCGNNCSYKVRRFNWFEYEWPAPLDLQLNPDVTKRTAGIMEKCTFCLQRINEGKNTAKNEGREVVDGDVNPACVASCPTDAMAFGNIKDKSSKVYKLSKSSRAYKVLDHHLNTQPSVIYLKRKRYFS